MDFHRIINILQQEHTLPNDEWKGAVLFLCSDEYVVFIKRSEKMPTHRGQVAFVGGHKHSDETDPWITIQREYEEETGLEASGIEFLGYLPVILTARLQAIVPVMARLKFSVTDFLEQVRSNGEWDEIMIYPWSELLKESSWNYAWRQGYTQGPIMFHTMKNHTYLPEKAKSHLLWGATAHIVWDFMRLYFKPENSSY